MQYFDFMPSILNLILQTQKPGKGTFGVPYDSTQGYTPKGQMILGLILITFGLYVGFKVWRSWRNEMVNKK